MGGAEARDEDDLPEWTYLTFDTDDSCAACGEAIHAGQAVGRINAQLIHAKCYRQPD